MKKLAMVLAFVLLAGTMVLAQEQSSVIVIVPASLVEGSEISATAAYTLSDVKAWIDGNPDMHVNVQVVTPDQVLDATERAIDLIEEKAIDSSQPLTGVALKELADDVLSRMGVSKLGRAGIILLGEAFLRSACVFADTVCSAIYP